MKICVSFRMAVSLVACASFLSVLAHGQAQSQSRNDIQSTPGSVRVHPPVDSGDHEQVVSYWTSETGWKSELQLRNNLSNQDLTVTPFVRLANGGETSLGPVTIKPQEVKSIDLESAIRAADAPQLVGTYGSVALRYHSDGYRNLYAAIMIRKTGQPIAFHVDAMGESQEFQSGSREGVWWLPNDSASDYLILTNQGQHDTPVVLSLFDSNGTESKQSLLLQARETVRLSIRKLLKSAQLGGSYGGIKVFSAAHSGSIDTVHFAFDEKAGFSAILKMFDNDANSRMEERDFSKTGVWTLRAPMLALSSADPSLGFPAGTALHPQLLIRNTLGKQIEGSLRFNWRNDSQAGTAKGPALRLSPYETQMIDVSALQAAGLIPIEAHWTSVILTTNTKPDDVVAEAMSYDQTLRYGAQTPFSDQLSYRWEGGMWEYDPYHSSIITVGNGGTKKTEALFTIFYNEGVEKYELEQTLEPSEQMWIDVGKLIREHVPDKNGRTLPADLTMGSYEFRDLTDPGFGSLFEGKITYDKTYGSVMYGCASCCGYGQPILNFNPLGIPFTNGASNGVSAADNCGEVVDLSSSFYYNWTTANGGIATVNYAGYHSAVAMGSTTSSTHANLPKSGMRFTCPITAFTPSGGDNVTPSVTFGDTPLVPLGKPVSTTATVGPTSNTTAITLTISVSSGTGSATFGDGTTSKTITTTTALTLVGVTASSTQNNMKLTAKVGSNVVGSMIFTVTGSISGAIPVNFRQTLVRVDPSAVLHFEYQWDSSSGNKADLASCTIEEYVTYVGANPYVFTSPPYVAGYSIPWPTLGEPGPASSPTLIDDHSHPGFQTPYRYNGVSSDQKYQFQCPYYQSNAWVQIYPPPFFPSLPLLFPLPHGSTPWTYQITKSGRTASMNLP